MPFRIAGLVALGLLLLTACGGSDDGRAVDTAGMTGTSAESARDQQFPDIVAADATWHDGSWTFSVTVSSPYDTPDRYADAWRVRGSDATVFGERVLAHDHQHEQPFTRSQSGIVVPDDVDTVVIEGRDLANGWGGGTLTYPLPATPK